MACSFTDTATYPLTASTKRNPAAVGGKVGAPVAKLASLAIAALRPVSAEIAEYYRLRSPREAFLTFAQNSPDVLEGDVMTVSGLDYEVQAVAAYPTPDGYTEIILGLKKGT